jgi:hypothetical protein
MSLSEADTKVTREYLFDFLSQLDGVAAAHEEVFDSDVRDNMAMAILHAFIKPTASYWVQEDLGMYSKEGNEKVKAALEDYINKMLVWANERSYDFHSRLDAFQDYSVKVGKHQRPYSSFFGHFLTEQFDKHGNVISDGM